MNEITIHENTLFDFLPHKHLGWYILILIDITSIFALALTGELYLWILIGMLTLAIIPTLIAIIKARKKAPRSLQLIIDNDSLLVRFEDQQSSVDKNLIKALIMHPDTSDGKQKLLIDLVCKCGKKDKTLLTQLPPGLFYGQRLKKLEQFIQTHLPYTELVFFDTSEI